MLKYFLWLSIVLCKSIQHVEYHWDFTHCIWNDYVNTAVIEIKFKVTMNQISNCTLVLLFLLLLLVMFVLNNVFFAWRNLCIVGRVAIFKFVGQNLSYRNYPFLFFYVWITDHCMYRTPKSCIVYLWMVGAK